jgi:hypothetical protein
MLGECELLAEERRIPLLSSQYTGLDVSVRMRFKSTRVVVSVGLHKARKW